jgi:uncharacterized membrane-anchored protein YjiN (DUF445 family)
LRSGAVEEARRILLPLWPRLESPILRRERVTHAFREAIHSTLRSNASQVDLSEAIERLLAELGRTPEQKRLLEEVSQALQAYEEESREFKREVQLLIEKKYEEKRNTLANSYEKAIRDLEVLERKVRGWMRS